MRGRRRRVRRAPAGGDGPLHVCGEAAAVREAAEGVADAVELRLEQHGVREVRVVVPVGVGCQRPDSRVFQPRPGVRIGALASAVEERADSQDHHPMMAFPSREVLGGH